MSETLTDICWRELYPNLSQQHSPVREATGTSGTVFYSVSDEGKTMLICGLGVMNSSYDTSSQPWSSYKTSLTSV